MTASRMADSSKRFSTFIVLAVVVAERAITIEIKIPVDGLVDLTKRCKRVPVGIDFRFIAGRDVIARRTPHGMLDG